MPELIGSRAMTPAERQRRSRSLRYLREKEAAEVALRAYVRSGLLGTEKEALREITELLVSLPDRLERLEAAWRDVDEQRKAGAASPR